MITRETRPRLASKVRLRWDRHTNAYLLLYPESGLILNPTASDILLHCCGNQTVGSIIDALVCRYRHGKEARPTGQEPAPADSGRVGEMAPGDREGEMAGDENQDKGGVLREKNLFRQVRDWAGEIDRLERAGEIDDIARDVVSFLQAMMARGLVRVEP